MNREDAVRTSGGHVHGCLERREAWKEVSEEIEEEKGEIEEGKGAGMRMERGQG